MFLFKMYIFLETLQKFRKQNFFKLVFNMYYYGCVYVSKGENEVASSPLGIVLKRS